MANTTENKTPRITKTMRIADIINLLKDEDTVHGTTAEQAIEFLEKEQELLEKKNKSGNKKQTADQLKNKEYATQILELLEEVPDTGYTCTEILRIIPEMNSNQRVSAVMSTLGKDGTGQVTKRKVKGEMRFFLVTEDEEQED